MDQDLSMSSWQGQIPDETMASHDRPDEFTDLLDFDFDFSTLDNVQQSGHAMPASSAQMQTTMMQDMQLTCMDPIQTTQPSPYTQMQSMDAQGDNNSVSLQLQPQFYAQKQQQQQPQQSMAPPGYGQTHAFIPPTPNSMEMHGRGRIYEPYTRGTDDQSAFTPLMSPAMTPLEQYRLPEYMPGEYFTPLTSPALEGRNPNNNFLLNNPSQLDMNFVSSPMEFPSHVATTAPSSPGAIRKHRRKMSFQSRSKAGTRLVRQSPSMRPLNSQQRQQIPKGSQSEEGPHSQVNTPASRSSLFIQSSSNESSGQDSVSPEPLVEPLMPPPALPQANGRSPHIATQESKQAPQSTQVTIAPAQSAAPAATPATLMRLQNQQHQDPSQTPFSRSGSVIVDDATDEVMEDISLPEPASGPLQSTTLNERTPSLTPRQTPAPTSARPGSASTGPSPQIGAMSSPAGPVGLRKPSMRTTKKRPSTSTHSAQISPALRPKMSPSLKPLIKGSSDNVSAETSALYLASKSNYQHILEGTVLPGVSYPDSLAENLSSKRTNHKLAEQGRRNRINTALKEIEGLLPPSLAQSQIKEGKEAGDAGTNGASKSHDKSTSSQPISKASTVEMAIVYIKSLQRDLEETREKLRVAEDKLAENNGVQQPLNPASPSGSDNTATKKPDAGQSPAEAVSTKSEAAKAAE